MSRIAVVHYTVPNNVADDNICNYIRSHAGVECEIIECKESSAPKVKGFIQFEVEFECHREDIEEVVDDLRLNAQGVRFVTKVAMGLSGER